jgi:hypothetical protein
MHTNLHKLYVYTHTHNVCVVLTLIILIILYKNVYATELDPHINSCSIYKNRLQFTDRLTRPQLSNGAFFKMSRSMLHVQGNSVHMSADVTSRYFLIDAGNHIPHPGSCPLVRMDTEWHADPMGHTTRFQPLTLL